MGLLGAADQERLRERFARRSLDQRHLGGWKTVAVAANCGVGIGPHQAMMLPRRVTSRTPPMPRPGPTLKGWL